MWCSVVWCGVVWCGVVWCGVEWCGVVWRGERKGTDVLIQRWGGRNCRGSQWLVLLRLAAWLGKMPSYSTSSTVSST